MMWDALSYAFFQRALAAGLLAAVACGIIGTLVVVRRIASISGGLAHASFGGIGLGYLAGFPPMAGALLFGLASALGIGLAEIRLRQGLDTLIAMVWAVGMALGIVFASLAPGPTPDLLSYLFGNILFVPSEYLWFAAGLDLLLLGVVLLGFRQIQATCFDEEFSWVIGVPVGLVFHVVLGLTALTVVLLIRVVGVILVIALLTIPAAIAGQRARTLGQMMLIATLLSAALTTGGLVLSYEPDLPPGATIIVLSGVVYLATLAWQAWKTRRAPGAA